MPKISTYTTQSTPALTDKLIGTDSLDNNATKNFSIGSVANLIQNSNEFNVLVARNTSDQELTAAQTKTQVDFGDQVISEYAIVDMNGTIRIDVAGSYRFIMIFNAGCIQTAIGDVHVDYYFNFEQRIAGVYTQILDTMQNTVFFDGNDTEPAQTLRMEYLVENITAGTLFTANFAADKYVAGVQGQMRSALVARPTSVVGMNNVPSAALYINKI